MFFRAHWRLLPLVCVFLCALPVFGAATNRLVQASLNKALQGTAAVAVVLDASSGHLLAVRHPREAAWLSSAPGSTLKPFFLTTALERGLIDGNTILMCHRYLRILGHDLDCTHPASLTVFRAADAIAYSCNNYFAQLSMRFAPGETAAVLRDYGFGSRPHLFSSESAGKVQEVDGSAERALQVLGIAGVAATPAQMAEAYWLLSQRMSPVPAVIQGLEESVGYGMAHSAATLGVRVLGKTGTASGPEERWSHGWFAAIASCRGKRIVIAVYVPHGNGADAALLAHRFFSAWRERIVR